MSIYVTSDLHFCHDRAFIYGARGFSSIGEMNLEIIKRYNSFVNKEDTVYILGDVLLGGDDSLEVGIELLSQLEGSKILIRGNHDSRKRVEAFKKAKIFEGIYDALAVRIHGYNFYLSHYPTITSNLEKENLRQCILNISGHTHAKKKFFYDLPYIYCACVDAHDCYPVDINQIIDDMKTQVRKCKEMI